jgi:hypothetical protein
LTIENNALGPQSVEALCFILKINGDTPDYNGRKVRTRLTQLEINKCSIGKILSNDIINALKKNRDIEDLQLSSFQFNREMVQGLSDFVTNNFSLKKLNLSWSEFVSDDLLHLLTCIKPVKHLQYINLSTIPIEGPACIQMITLIKEHIINNNSLFHLDMS